MSTIPASTDAIQEGECDEAVRARKDQKVGSLFTPAAGEMRRAVARDQHGQGVERVRLGDRVRGVAGEEERLGEHLCLGRRRRGDRDGEQVALGGARARRVDQVVTLLAVLQPATAVAAAPWRAPPRLSVIVPSGVSRGRPGRAAPLPPRLRRR